MPPEASEKKYWAFISYSSKDKKWGQWLHKRLENYPIPKEFQGTKIFDGAVLGENLRPVFRDRDEFSGASNLGHAIQEALQQSRFLIVLCSPNSARSQWVNQEIKDYISISGDKHILALILDGEPNASSIKDLDETLECFPPALRYPVEPLAGDLRKNGDGKERGFLKILAGISQLDFDVLYRRHERAQRSRMIAWGAVAAIIIAALAGLSAFSIKKSREQQVLLDNVALADHDSALQASEQGRYRESAAYYARSLAIRPNNNTVAVSAVGSSIFSDTLFAKQRHILKAGDKITALSIHPTEDFLHAETSGSPLTFSLVDGKKAGDQPGVDWLQIRKPDKGILSADFPWLAGAVPGLSGAIVSPDGSKLFAGASSGKIHKFDIATRTDEWASIAKQRKNRISGIAISPCGQTLAVSDWDSSLSLVDAGNGTTEDSIQFAYNVERLFFSPNGFFLITTSQDGYVRVFDTGTSPLLLKTARDTSAPLPFAADETETDFDLTKIKTALPHPPEIHRVSADAKYLVAGSRKGHLMMLSLVDDTLNTTKRSARITDIEISPDSRTCYASSRDRNLAAYDLKTGAEKWRQAFKGYVNSISLSHDGKFIAAASDDFTFRIFDTASGKTVWTTLTDNCVELVAFEGNSLHAATKDNFLELDCSHLFRNIPDERGELASFLVTHAAMRVHQLTPIRRAKRSAAPDNIQTILDWKNQHPSKKTRSPFSKQSVSETVSQGLRNGSIENARQLHRLAPWHPLTPVSLARLPENEGNTIRQRYLCEMSVKRFRETEHEGEFKQDRKLAARWMKELGFDDLAAETDADR